AIGWLQSYVSLRALALRGHEPGWEAATWPAVLDVFALVMGLAAVRARRERQPDRYAEVLVSVYSLAAIAGTHLDLAPGPGDGRGARPAAGHDGGRLALAAAALGGRTPLRRCAGRRAVAPGRGRG